MIMFGYDVFNATSLVNIPGAPSSTTFKEILRAYPLADSSFGPNRGYAGVNGYVWSKVDVEHNNGNENHLRNLDRDAIDDLFEWSSGSDSGDWLILYPSDAFHIKGSDATTSLYEIRFVTNDKNSSKAYDYVVNMKKNGSTTGQSIPTACNSSSVPCFSNYVRDDAAGYVGFRVRLSSASDYLSFDVGRPNSSAGARDGATGAIHAARIKTQCGTWERHDDNEFQDKGGSRIQIKLISVTANAVEGCTDPLADNPTSDATVDDGSCTYTTASIDSFTVSPSTIKIGEPVTVSWNLSSSKFSKVSILYEGSEIVPSDRANAQNSSFQFTPTSVGTATFGMTVTWDKPNTQTRKSSRQVTVQSATSFVQCTDPNRAKDGNGECADCNSGYYLDSTTGLCSQCSDPNRRKKADGSCGDCNAGYEIVDGICQESANDCADSNREKNSDGSCASSCKSGYAFDDSNMCVSTDTTTSSESSGLNWGLIGVVGVLAAVSVVAIK